jgi:tetratricopeptide (TPR) repeat protein
MNNLDTLAKASVTQVERYIEQLMILHAHNVPERYMYKGQSYDLDEAIALLSYNLARYHEKNKAHDQALASYKRAYFYAKDQSTLRLAIAKNHAHLIKQLLMSGYFKGETKLEQHNIAVQLYRELLVSNKLSKNPLIWHTYAALLHHFYRTTPNPRPVPKAQEAIVSLKTAYRYKDNAEDLPTFAELWMQLLYDLYFDTLSKGDLAGEEMHFVLDHYAEFLPLIMGNAALEAKFKSLCSRFEIILNRTVQ